MSDKPKNPKEMMDSVCDSLQYLSAFSNDEKYQEQYNNVNRFVKSVQMAIIADEIRRRMHR